MLKKVTECPQRVMTRPLEQKLAASELFALSFLGERRGDHPAETADHCWEMHPDLRYQLPNSLVSGHPRTLDFMHGLHM